MAKKYLDLDGLKNFWEKLVIFINEHLSLKQDKIDDLEEIREGALKGATAIQDEKIFIGTQEEYDIANSNGSIKPGSLVIILKQDELNSLVTAVLGTALLGKMKLGQK